VIRFCHIAVRTLQCTTGCGTPRRPSDGICWRWRLRAGSASGNPIFQTLMCRVWAAALPKRRDVLAVAQPGAGKTLAYLLTIAARLMGAPAPAAAAGAAGAAAGSAAAGGAEEAAAEADAQLEAPPAPQGLVLVPTR